MTFIKSNISKKQLDICKNFPNVKYLYCLNITTSMPINVVNEK